MAEIKMQKPELYVDSSNLYKILVGEIKTGKVVSAINEILKIERSDKTSTN